MRTGKWNVGRLSHDQGSWAREHLVSLEVFKEREDMALSAMVVFCHRLDLTISEVSSNSVILDKQPHCETHHLVVSPATF